MIFDNIIHGTQYYRSPTPLPEEWEGDISNLENFQLDAMQIRINWRWNERRENEYDFSDVDRLVELAQKYNRKIIIKFLLECAPQYIFDKYGGTRIGPRGEELRGGAHGAFYGGWRPCFTNPMVQERAKLFVEKVAERYANCENLILWNAWNEIRNKPIEDCFCPHCRKAFGDYLKEKFGTVENLNAFYGAAEDSFETIALPSMPHGIWDIYEFKKFKGSNDLAQWLTFVKDAIRKYDKVRPVMSHVGFAAAYQSALSDVCDDYEVAKAVDFFGTSVACECAMDTHHKRMDYLMLNSYIRSVDENYFVHEIYPGHGRFKSGWYDTPYDMRFKLYSTLGSGAKGIVYWQYRAERVGNECDCAGIMQMDGTPRPVAYEVADFGKYLHRDMEYFAQSSAEKGEIGIVFDFDSMLLSEIEDSCGEDFKFDWCCPKFYYRNAHAGFYRMAKNLNYKVDYISSRETDKFAEYKVLYVPYGSMLSQKTIAALTEFAKKGTLILDEGFIMRQPNTWINPYALECKDMMQVKMIKRRDERENISYNGKIIPTSPFKTEYEVQGAESLLQFGNGESALHKVSCGEGNIYLLGFSLGYSYYESESEACEELLEHLLAGLDLHKQQYADTKNGIYELTLTTQNAEKITFLFNISGKTQSFEAPGKILTYGGDFKKEKDDYSLEDQQMGYIITAFGEA